MYLCGRIKKCLTTKIENMEIKQLKTRALNKLAKGSALTTTAILIFLDVNTRQLITGITGLILVILSLLDYQEYLRKKGRSKDDESRPD